MDAMDRILPYRVRRESPGSLSPVCRTGPVCLLFRRLLFQMLIPKRLLLRRSALYCNRRSQWFLIVPVMDAHPPLNDQEGA